MTKVFFTVLGMSVTASLVIAMVLVLRLFLRRMPRIFSYILWLPVLWRLLCPFPLEAGWGIIPTVSLAEFDRKDGFFLWENGQRTQEEAADNNTDDYPENGWEGAGTGKGEEGTAPKGSKGAQSQSKSLSKTVNFQYAIDISIFLRQTEGFWRAAAVIWLSGCFVLALYGTGSYVIFMRKLKRCRSGAVQEPFVAGLIKPVIYLPDGLLGKRREMVMVHEKVHIARRDYLVKPVAALAVCIHWFNPLAWLAYYFMEQDMEVSCDEAALKKLGFENRRDYANTLLYLSVESGRRMKCPIAFGEKSVKVRIKNTMEFKRAKIWAVVLTTAAVLAVSLLLVVNGSESGKSGEELADAGMGGGAILPRQEGVPGTDTAGGAEFVYMEGDSGREAAEEEGVFLPAERIAYTQPASGSSQSTTDHEYYPSGWDKGAVLAEGEDGIQLLPAEEITVMDIQEASAVSTEGQEGEHEYSSYADDYAPLLRNVQESGRIYDQVKILFDIPVANARISDGYVVRTHPITQEKRFHSGIDFAAEEGEPVMAAADGTVFETGFDNTAGNYVILQHKNGEMTYYANCGEILAQTGQNVARGEQIAVIGISGRSTGAHLHFASSSNGKYTEPVFVKHEAVQ